MVGKILLSLHRENAKEILKPLKERKQKIPHGSKKVGFEIEFVFNVSEQIIEMSGLTDRS